MTINRVLLALLAVFLLPGLALAQTDTRATFTVQKQFSDGNNNTPVTVHLQCFTGLDQNQQQTVQTDNAGAFEVKFVNVSFDQGQLDCNVWEELVPGYTASYQATSYIGTATSINSGNGGCHFENVDTSNAANTDPQNVCTITNTPIPQTVSVTKEWIIEGEGGDALDPSYKLTLYCEDEIIGGKYSNWSGNWKKKFYNDYGTSDHTYTAAVIPDWYNGTNCWVNEDVWDSSVEVDNNCNDLDVVIGDGDSCTITNTVWFEGIPTLSEYGMAILALLMLGVGFVGFRRFV